jgi:O-acetyl-ADP-ribose deacetylase (regulator of RNase III)
MHIFELRSMLNPKFVINFPTKRDWRANSRYEDIEAGLEALVADVRRLGITSIAVPPLGCGLGGLDWNRVRPMIETAFAVLPSVRVLLYEPAGALEARQMLVRTTRPQLTIARALFIRLMDLYASQSYRLTLLEIQKLAYFLQEAGQPLRLRYEAGHYGPCAPNLNKVLEALERHYTSGYGDTQKPDVEIELLPGAADEAKAFLAGHADEHRRLERVSRLIEGFETPYGLELLSSVHWVATHADPPSEDERDAANALAAWNERKRRMFRPEHIPIAWNRLASENWIAA